MAAERLRQNGSGTRRPLAGALVVLGLLGFGALPALGAGQSAPYQSALPSGPQAASDFTINLGAANWNDGSDFWRLSTVEREDGLTSFTPRQGALDWAFDGAAAGRSGDEGVALTIGLRDSIGPVDFSLSGNYRAASLPRPPHEVGLSRSGDLEQYRLNLNLGLAGFVLSGAYSREYDGSLAEGNLWDAGVAYGTGPWTFGVNYLYGTFQSTAPALPGEDEMSAIAGAVSYSIGPSFTARAQLSYTEWQGNAGLANGGTAGILGFQYNF